jgi:hypothetical protein
MAIVTFPDVFDGRGLSAALWKDFPYRQILDRKDLNVGYGWQMDPMSLPNCPVNITTVADYNSYRCYTDSAEYIRPTLASEYDGPPALRLFATTDNQEAWAQACNGAEPFVISDTPAECRDLVFEVCLRQVNITTAKSGWFVGLMEAGLATNTIGDDGTMIDKDFIGFFKTETATNEVAFVYRKNGQAMQTKLAIVGRAAAVTFVKLGFRFDSAAKTIMPYYGTGDNSTTPIAPVPTGLITAANIAAATFPDSEYMAPIFGLKNAHADDFYIDVRAAACAQLSKAAD